MSTYPIFFARHGATEPNVQGVRCGGDSDVQLVENGLVQAFKLGLLLRRLVKIDVVVCGSLMRTQQTARIISGVLRNVDVKPIPQLNERRLGEWNGKKIADTEDDLRAGVTPIGGESEAQFRQRIREGLEIVHQIVHEAQFHARVHEGRDVIRMEPPRILIIGSKGVGRVLDILTGGDGQLNVDNCSLHRFRLPTQLPPEASRSKNVIALRANP